MCSFYRRMLRDFSFHAEPLLQLTITILPRRGVIASIAVHLSFRQPRHVLPPGADLHRKRWVKLNRLHCGTAHVGDTLKLWGVQESTTCACGHITESVPHVVVDCMIHKAPDGFAGLRCPDAATRYWLQDLNIEI